MLLEKLTVFQIITKFSLVWEMKDRQRLITILPLLLVQQSSPYFHAPLLKMYF